MHTNIEHMQSKKKTKKNPKEKYTQLTNNAPSILRLGIPSYNWLNDDEHGVRNSHATTFPDGCGLGGTWSQEMMNQGLKIFYKNTYFFILFSLCFWGIVPFFLFV